MLRILNGEYFFRSLPTQPLRIMRMVCGAELLFYYLRITPVFLDLFSPKYLGSSEYFPIPRADLFYYALLSLILFSSAAVMAGWKTRASLVLLLLTQTVLAYLNPSAFWRWNFMVRHYLLFLLIVDPWAKDEFAPAWTWRVFQIQTCLIYFVAQLNRWGNQHWLNGDSLLRVLTDGDTSLWPSVDWVSHAQALRPLGYFGFGLEWLGALLIFLGPLQSPVALALMGMHASLEFLSKVELWQPFMIATLLFFMPPKIFNRKSSPPAFANRPFVGALMILFFVLALIHAWPKRFLNEDLQGIQAVVSLPVIYSTFSGTAKMNMFASFGSPGRKCFFVVAERAGGRLETLVHDEPDGCRNGGPKWLGRNELVTAIIRAHKYHQRRKDRVGQYFCHRARDAVAIFAARVQEPPNAIEPILYFDCVLREELLGQPDQLLTYMTNEHLWLESFFAARRISPVVSKLQR